MLWFLFNLDYVHAKFACTHFAYFMDIFVNSCTPTHTHISLITQNQDEQMKKLAWRELR